MFLGVEPIRTEGVVLFRWAETNRTDIKGVVFLWWVGPVRIEIEGVALFWWVEPVKTNR